MGHMKSHPDFHPTALLGFAFEQSTHVPLLIPPHPVNTVPGGHPAALSEQLACMHLFPVKYLPEAGGGQSLQTPPLYPGPHASNICPTGQIFFSKTSQLLHVVPFLKNPKLHTVAHVMFARVMLTLTRLKLIQSELDILLPAAHGVHVPAWSPPHPVSV
jgi:hypothetical protein